ncbi:uncharacterized protein HKW66_Vig0139290 [Vigna angularis]|uniref:Myb-like domain-containing protein n=2 Tax=Phaseolus angularis TaxID=3914 RepID=A0A8T0KIL2_PHAAN|nr:uncharacterized protein LOC108339029 [Vigna angularis]KAG2397835.1 uncharacterized protein HKW66_Vig0139290 [Vigna angularis]BAT90854.1 hypothetical protein VIGAN_06214500 [Vigna angularis var. angularis]
MANPSGNHEEEQTTHVASSFNGNLAADTSPTALAMKHNSGIALDWTPREQTILEEGLSLFASEPNLTRYAKIAINLNNKTVRDVALRVRWMNKKENCKRRKDEFSRKSKDRKEKVSDPAVRSSHFTAQSNVSPYSPAMKMMDNDDSICHKAIGDPAGELLEKNAQALNNISTNLAALQFQENINLFSQTRDNIIKILNDMNDMSEAMKQMPPLPFKINETIFSSIIPNTIHQML